ncbi:substrate-binding periplasmic protein [Cohnella sp. CIP 111063]|uniref:substrate-binding periplasmic protein n=1 Tax=unclassified Cohnella TaxID=2636738 RepID=UPI003519C528
MCEEGSCISVHPPATTRITSKTTNNRQERKIEVMYGNGAAHDLVELIRTKRVDATLQTDFSVRFETDEEGNQALKLVGEPLFEGGVHYVLRKEEDELAAKLDEAVRAAKADGTIAKLSMEWFGQDFTKSLQELGESLR